MTDPHAAHSDSRPRPFPAEPRAAHPVLGDSLVRLQRAEAELTATRDELAQTQAALGNAQAATSQAEQRFRDLQQDPTPAQTGRRNPPETGKGHSGTDRMLRWLAWACIPVALLIAHLGLVEPRVRAAEARAGRADSLRRSEVARLRSKLEQQQAQTSVQLGELNQKLSAARMRAMASHTQAGTPEPHRRPVSRRHRKRPRPAPKDPSQLIQRSHDPIAGLEGL